MEVGNNSGFGNGFGNGDGAWWIIILLLFGWGRNGYGAGFGGNGGIGENFVLQTDFATIERKLDGINNGICDSTFALNNTITNGFFGVQNSLTQGFSGINTALLQGNYALSSQLADCCCKTQRAIDGVNYNMATNTCAITNNATMNTRDIIDAVNANYRALHEEIVANRIEDKNAQITAQQNEINALRLKASQEAQNAYLISQLGPKCPEPAYVVNGPTPVNFPTNCCNTFSGFNSCCGNY
ncbi:MAG: hypothetical protein J6C46_08510 [Clostridia bacterium]|nr:hypothetical protein [Clostridia bacterium]